MRCRRTYLQVFLFFFAASFFAQNTITYQCILRSNSQSDTMCDGKVIPVFGITSTLGEKAKIPAKILYCNEGDSVILDTRSISQGEHHTIHLHGLDVDTRNDGDPSTSFWLSHMQDTTYSFKAKNAGTYLYHCHVADVVHVQMGMYGMIVVRAAGGAKTAWTGGPAYDKDIKWLMSEVDSSWHYEIPDHDPVMDTVNIPEYLPDYFLINGKCGGELYLNDSMKIFGAQGEKILMRLANIGFNANRIIFPSFLKAKIIESDGRPFSNAIINDTCFIMPGERFSVMLQPDMQAAATVSVQYIDMNTGNLIHSNSVQTNINGIIGLKKNFDENNMVSIYPNPMGDELHVKVKVYGKIINYSLYDVFGRSVLSGFFSGEAFLNTTSLCKGVYNLILYNEGVKITGKTVIKQ